ncbi:hypothetical protein [Hwanghaeella sp. LZ110]|uniref:hypothetical protein n=1 Tax=Hwanghaeella sp. LZ110 TaxID=3402810 RepID=UPI003B67ED8C
MKPISLAEMAGRLAAGAQVFIARKPALWTFGDTRDDFLKSFWCAALLFPFFLWAIYSVESARYGDAQFFIRLISHTIYYIIAWTYWPLIMATVSQNTAHPENWIRYVVAVNWMMAVPILLQWIIILTLADNDPVMANGLLTGLRLWALLVHGWILQTLFKTKLGLTIGLVIADFLINQVLSKIEDFIILSHG